MKLKPLSITLSDIREWLLKKGFVLNGVDEYLYKTDENFNLIVKFTSKETVLGNGINAEVIITSNYSAFATHLPNGDNSIKFEYSQIFIERGELISAIKKAFKTLRKLNKLSNKIDNLLLHYEHCGKVLV